MKEIFEQYGGPIITVVAIAALIGIIVFLVKGNNTVVAGMFQNLLDNFQNRVNEAAGF